MIDLMNWICNNFINISENVMMEKTRCTKYYQNMLKLILSHLSFLCELLAAMKILSITLYGILL